ncbi:MAG: hypothetical protein NTW86_10415 [Candidatus Sumerlaeota bacterium]|nr:hypothetical protein [Candidatus Sumerlaeota bacterium]
MIATAKAQWFAARPLLAMVSLAFVATGAAAQPQENGRESAEPKEAFKQADLGGDGAPAAERRLGIGFALTTKTADLVSSLTEANDFIDVMLRGEAPVLLKEHAEGPVKVACVFRSLDHMRETISLLQGAGVKCAYLGYNPEQSPGTPNGELDDFVDSVKRAKEAAAAYGAGLLMGPGMRFMMGREGDYAKAAPYADVWLVQSQQFQIDRETRQRATPSEYRANVQRVVGLLREANPRIRIWVQIVVWAGPNENPFSAQEIVALARSIEDTVDAVRIYTSGVPNGVETLREVIRSLRGDTALAAPAR